MEEKIVVVCPNDACGRKIRVPAGVNGKLHCPICQAFIEVSWVGASANVRLVEVEQADAPGSDGGYGAASDSDLPVGWDSFAAIGAPLPRPIQAPHGFLGKKSANCPYCGRLMDDVSSVTPTRCDRCERYASARSGFLHALDEDYVHPSAVFTLSAHTLWKEHRLPAICCQCGAPATRSLSLGSTAERLGFRGSFPYCGRHSLGASVGSDNNEKYGLFGVQVRSYRFYREFLRLNRS